MQLRESFLTRKSNVNVKSVHFRLRFVSLISPQIMANLRLFFVKNKSRRLILKQSYLLITWFYYLGFVKSTNPTKTCNFSSLPVRQKHYTILKAPIAHKNWSKEQIKLKFYHLVVSFSSNLSEDFDLKQVNAALLFALITKKKLPSFETNLLFLKSLAVFFYATDSIFFNYYRFIGR